MGSYCSLSIDDYEFDVAKSYINPFWSCIFKESDRKNIKTNQNNSSRDDATTSNEHYNVYSAKISIIKKRLDILGYTIEKTKEKYDLNLKEKIAETELDLETYSASYYVRDLKYLKMMQINGLGFWVNIAKEVIFKRKINFWDENSFVKQDEDICFWALNASEDEAFLKFPETQYGFFLRALLEAANDEQLLILDVTSLISSGYYREDESICEQTAKDILNSTLQFEKIILLTEGVSDSKILSQSLNLLYPELIEYFYFMDFGTMKAEAGTSALERTLKSFAAAGISNKIIALFDNDTAGHSAMMRLEIISFPKNIKAIALPNLSLATNYPTIGPQGDTIQNINGSACSIELYLGKDILTKNGDLIPVAWKGYEYKVSRYQGEIVEKDVLQKLFFKKIKDAKDKNIIESQDWSGIKLIFESIFHTLATMS